MVYIISEIGINHNGSIEKCKELIMLSKVAGADYVKIQKRNPDICVPEHQKSIRSSDPNFSVAAIGRHCKYFSETNNENTYGEESFFDKFHKLNGKILDFNFLGSTIIHYYERKLNVPYRFDKKFYGLINDSKKNIFVFSRKLKDKKNIADVLPITNLMKKDKILKVSKLGRGEITCVTSHDFFKYIKKKYKKNNLILTESHRYQKLENNTNQND